MVNTSLIDTLMATQGRKRRRAGTNNLLGAQRIAQLHSRQSNAPAFPSQDEQVMDLGLESVRSKGGNLDPGVQTIDKKKVDATTQYIDNLLGLGGGGAGGLTGWSQAIRKIIMGS